MFNLINLIWNRKDWFRNLISFILRGLNYLSIGLTAGHHVRTILCREPMPVDQCLQALMRCRLSSRRIEAFWMSERTFILIRSIAILITSWKEQAFGVGVITVIPDINPWNRFKLCKTVIDSRLKLMGNAGLNLTVACPINNFPNADFLYIASDMCEYC